MIPFAQAVHARTHRRVIGVFGAQMGKSDSVLDIIGERLDTSPVPTLYVGPNKQMITEQWEPRIMQLLDEAPSLRRKVARGKRMTKTKKVIAGVPLRLAHAGSSTALKSDPFGLALTDEADELMANVKGQGNPIELVDLRGQTYADFVHAIVSTPSKGPSEVKRDEESGLEFWDDDVDLKEIESTIWKLWLSGTRHHWAWPCPECHEYFIPRFSCLGWDKPKSPDGRELPSTAAMASRTAHLCCPNCGSLLYDQELMKGSNQTVKEWMNSNGVYVAPGQKVTPDGVVHGAAPENWVLSYWASGLASPFVSWGERAAAFVAAVRSGESDKIQGVINGGFGEVYSPRAGDAPEWKELSRLRLPYARGSVPEGVMFLTCGVDVQKNRLVYVVRGWGRRQGSWLIDHGEIWGETQFDDVWIDLGELLEERYGGLPIRRTLVDSGFRPGKPDMVPEHKVYEFCRRFTRSTYAAKGMSRPQRTPLSTSKIDVTPDGGRSKYSLELVRLDPDFFKSWVHQRLNWPEDQPGAWQVHEETDEDYFRQLVSEARVKKPSGGAVWVPRSKENHYLDCEALAYAAAYMLGVQRLRERPEDRPRRRDDDDSEIEQQKTPAAPVGQPTQTVRENAMSALARLNRPRGAAL